jgi:hypothetical protein
MLSSLFIIQLLIASDISVGRISQFPTYITIKPEAAAAFLALGVHVVVIGAAKSAQRTCV